VNLYYELPGTVVCFRPLRQAHHGKKCDDFDRRNYMQTMIGSEGVILYVRAYPVLCLPVVFLEYSCLLRVCFFGYDHRITAGRAYSSAPSTVPGRDLKHYDTTMTWVAPMYQVCTSFLLVILKGSWGLVNK